MYHQACKIDDFFYYTAGHFIWPRTSYCKSRSPSVAGRLGQFTKLSPKTGHCTLNFVQRLAVILASLCFLPIWFFTTRFPLTLAEVLLTRIDSAISFACKSAWDGVFGKKLQLWCWLTIDGNTSPPFTRKWSLQRHKIRLYLKKKVCISKRGRNWNYNLQLAQVKCCNHRATTSSWMRSNVHQGDLKLIFSALVSKVIQFLSHFTCWKANNL